MSRPFRRRRLAALGGAVAVAAVAVASCGVPLDDDPQAITRTTITEAPTDQTTTPGPDATDLAVYFLDDETLRAVTYPVAGEPTLSQALTFVLAGVPADAGEDPELHSAVPPQTKLRSAAVIDGVATIDLSSEISEAIRNPLQKQAYAQLVFTAMAFDPEAIDQVTFLVDGSSVDVLTDENNQTLVTTDSYDRPLNPR